jgi:hypothetical protein
VFHEVVSSSKCVLHEPVSSIKVRVSRSYAQSDVFRAFVSSLNICVS